jgi:hypothetical protein
MNFSIKGKVVEELATETLLFFVGRNNLYKVIKRWFVSAVYFVYDYASSLISLGGL